MAKVEGQEWGTWMSTVLDERDFDLAIDTATPRAVPLVFNGRTMAVRNLKSGTDGVVIGVFE